MITLFPKLTDWETDCLRWRNEVLRGPDAHWCNCNDWDGLPVDAFTPEYSACTEDKTLLGRVCNWFYMKWFNWRSP